MNTHRHEFAAFAISAAVGLAIACSTETHSALAPVPAGQGSFAVALLDAPPDSATELWVTIDQVTAHVIADGTPSRWVAIPMAAPKVALDLLKLQSKAVELGLVNLPKGATVTQVRLLVDASADNHAVLKDGTRVPLKIPSGSQSGIKLRGPWQISECSQTTVTFDFDGKKSIFSHPARQGTEWILRPVIRLVRSEVVSVACTQNDAGADAGTGPLACDLANPQCPADGLCRSIGETPTCQGMPGAPCALDNECLSGTCDSATGRCGLVDIAEPCAANDDCRSTVCDATNHCAPGGGGAPCQTNGDCVSALCTSEGTCSAPPSAEALPAGSDCQADAACQSGWCDQGHCADSGQGQPCTSESNCQAGSGMACISGTCSFPAPN